MSWVMNITAVPVSRLRRSMRARISAWIVTSSAVVGSSQMRSRGSQASAMAMTTRWRMPPDSSCGYCVSRRSGSGMRTIRMSSSARARAASRDSPLWTRNPSVSWRSTVKTGLSEVIGSWKIMPISLPRIVRMSGSGACARSTVSALRSPAWPRRNSSRPPAMWPPPNSTSRISDSDDTDLPEPDSPTTATVSPGAIEKLTSSTPTTVPCEVSNSTRRLWMSMSGPASARAWVGSVSSMLSLRRLRRR